jgi:hypothetical protein
MFITLHQARNGSPVLFNTDNIVRCSLVSQKDRKEMGRYNKWDMDLIGCDVVDVTQVAYHDPDGHCPWFDGILVRETVEEVARIIKEGT